jgi:hypothetical protein
MVVPRLNIWFSVTLSLTPFLSNLYSSCWLFMDLRNKNKCIPGFFNVFQMKE